jgi:hypothetical protein
MARFKKEREILGSLNLEICSQFSTLDERMVGPHTIEGTFIERMGKCKGGRNKEPPVYKFLGHLLAIFRIT